MRFKWSSVFLFILVSFLISTSAFANTKELKSRLGVGYSNQIQTGDATGIPSLTTKYYPDNDLAFSGAVGIKTGDQNSAFGLLLKIYKTIFPEDNMLFYMGAGAGLVSQKVAGANNSGFQLMGIVGGEFFFAGLDSLGFTFEAGIAVVSLSNSVSFVTIGQAPVTAGIIFYF